MNCNVSQITSLLNVVYVSIPNRDFGELQYTPFPGNSSSSVSIPNRDFGELQSLKGQANRHKYSVSIPNRDFGELQLKGNHLIFPLPQCFNP